MDEISVRIGPYSEEILKRKYTLCIGDIMQSRISQYPFHEREIIYKKLLRELQYRK